MLEHRALRFVVEALILVAVAAAVTVADLRSLVIVGVMVLTWAVVSLLEWAFLQGESHFASGLPPRYYVAQLPLPAPSQSDGREALDPPPPIPLEPAAQQPVEKARPDAGIAEPDPPPEVPLEELRREPVADVADKHVPEEDMAAPPPTFEPLEEPEPELDYKLLAAELRSARPGASSWFDSELPGGLDNAGLFSAALAELEDESARAAEALAQTVRSPEGATEPQSRPAGRRLLPGRSRRGD